MGVGGERETTDVNSRRNLGQTSDERRRKAVRLGAAQKGVIARGRAVDWPQVGTKGLVDLLRASEQEEVREERGRRRESMLRAPATGIQKIRASTLQFRLLFVIRQTGIAIGDAGRSFPRLSRLHISVQHSKSSYGKSRERTWG